MLSELERLNQIGLFSGFWNPGWDSPTKTPQKFVPEVLAPKKSLKDL